MRAGPLAQVNHVPYHMVGSNRVLGAVSLFDTYEFLGFKSGSHTYSDQCSRDTAFKEHFEAGRWVNEVACNPRT